jgi:sugar phosphate isomerase/epimerase
MMDRLGIEFISTLGMNPVEAIHLVAGLGLRRIGMAPAPITANPHHFAPWDFRSDPALVRATKTASRDHGVDIVLGEGFVIMPGVNMADAEPMVDIMAELGAPVLNSCSVEPDRGRALDEFSRFAEMAAQRGLIATLEFMPMLWPATLADVLDFITASGAANARLLLDAMHVYRSGATTAEVAALDPAMIAYVQLCDVPMPAQTSDYGEEARHERRCPSEGDLPLAGFLAAIPDDITIGLEVPMISRAVAGVGVREVLAPCVAASQQLLA